MDDGIRNPRSAPRVCVQGQANIQVRGEVRRGTVRDVGPGGCLVLVDEPLVRGVAVRVWLMGDGVGEPLAGVGRVAWVRSAVTGIEFAPQALPTASAWYQRFLEVHPQLRPPALPRELPWETPLFAPRSPPPPGLAPDEVSVLRAVTPGIAAATLVRDSGLAECRASRAIFGLQEKGALSLTAPVPAVPDRRRADPARLVAWAPAPPAPRSRHVPDSNGGLLRGIGATGRSSRAQTLLDAALDAAEKGLVGTALPLVREALQHAPHDREIAAALASIAYGPRDRWSAVGTR